MTKEIVIAAYDKDLSWVSNLNSDIKKTIYRKGYPANINEILIEPNIGRCVHTFFNHIYERYDTLSDITFFAQDYPFDHWENIIEIINSNDILNSCISNSALNVGGYFGFHYNSIGTMWRLYESQQFDGGKILPCYSNGQPQDNNSNINVDIYFNNLFTNTKPLIYEFIPGGHFGITKEQIHIRPKLFYKKIVNLLLDNVHAPWVFERLECYIFSNKFKIKNDQY